MAAVTRRSAIDAAVDRLCRFERWTLVGVPSISSASSALRYRRRRADGQLARPVLVHPGRAQTLAEHWVRSAGTPVRTPNPVPTSSDKLSRLATVSSAKAVAAGSAGTRPLILVSSSIETVATLRDSLDHGDELLGSVALLTGKPHELVHLRHHHTALWCSSDGDPTTTTKLQ